jgi:hypothetical protein
VHGCPAVKQNTCDKSYWYERVDGTKEAICCETTYDATWYSQSVHDQKKSQCLG